MGVDVHPQPYPFELIADDALAYLVALLDGSAPELLEYVDAFHASVPCQAFSDLKGLAKTRSTCSSRRALCSSARAGPT